MNSKRKSFTIREEAFPYFFYFLEERMNMFWRKQGGEAHFTDDPILSQHRFTNVYRATDRTSQYLIKNVIYNPAVKHMDGEDVLLRILVFKIFNKSETWEFLEQNHGEISLKTFDVAAISKLLESRMQQKETIFNAAYTMPGKHENYTQYKRKHEMFLNMVDTELVKKKKLTMITKAESLEVVYKMLRECSLLGDFLAYQFAIDFNYSEVINFDENSFVKAGKGAIDGIKKCFVNLGGFKPEDAIKYTHYMLEHYQRKYGYTNFKDLYGRKPTLIDIQNCFCETDKYLRVKMPELKIGKTKIKQKFTSPQKPQSLFLPPKWGIAF